ncbi:hypothetical protein BJ741DRAFT_619927 [Chytriomyces cf. hyalinus JEL632]|nr:hypothetical protein BJ741DRAFT_619927 [Chytriomyces cf. hyalinus JEL632]
MEDPQDQDSLYNTVEAPPSQATNSTTSKPPVYELVLEPPNLMSSPELAHLNHLIQAVLEALSQVKRNRSSLKRLTGRAHSIMLTINEFVRLDCAAKEGVVGPLPASIKRIVDSLLELLKAIEAFVKKQGSTKFMNSFVNREQIAARISQFNQEMTAVAQDLTLSIEVDSKAWADEDREDRKSDLEELDHTLQHLVDNDYKILNALELKQVEYFEAIEALEKNIAEHIDRSLEQKLDRLFMERALTCLRRASDSPLSTKPKPPPEWVLTSWEIEIGESISHGGFGEVLKATWLGHTLVAVKRLHMRLETSKLKEDFLREVKTWYPLRHPHIVPLLGACATAERPFMVSPFMGRGHALQFMDWCGRRDRGLIEGKAVKLLYEVSLGMQYLHARGVVHGDLKAVNILIDEYENAYVADFGFATLKQFTSTRLTGAGAANFGGTLRWMAPERLQGAKLSPPVDVYAYSMTCFEILSEGDVPLTDSPDALLYQHVVNAHLRPEKPDCCHETFPATSNQLFRLMQTCWSPDPLSRPSFSSTSISMKAILKEAQSAQHQKAETAIQEAGQARIKSVQESKTATGEFSEGPIQSSGNFMPFGQKEVGVPLPSKQGGRSRDRRFDHHEFTTVNELPLRAHDLHFHPHTRTHRDHRRQQRRSNRGRRETQTTRKNKYEEARSRDSEDENPSDSDLSSSYDSDVSDHSRSSNLSFSSDVKGKNASASTDRTRTSAATDDLHFEPGTWGAWVYNLLPILPVDYQKDVKEKAHEFAKQLAQEDVKFEGSGAFIDFLKDVKNAGAKASAAAGGTLPSEATPPSSASKPKQIIFKFKTGDEPSKQDDSVGKSLEAAANSIATAAKAKKEAETKALASIDEIAKRFDAAGIFLDERGKEMDALGASMDRLFGSKGKSQTVIHFDGRPGKGKMVSETNEELSMKQAVLAQEQQKLREQEKVVREQERAMREQERKHQQQLLLQQHQYSLQEQRVRHQAKQLELAERLERKNKKFEHNQARELARAAKLEASERKMEMQRQSVASSSSGNSSNGGFLQNIWGSVFGMARPNVERTPPGMSRTGSGTPNLSEMVSVDTVTHDSRRSDDFSFSNPTSFPDLKAARSASDTIKPLPTPPSMNGGEPYLWKFPEHGPSPQHVMQPPQHLQHPLQHPLHSQHPFHSQTPHYLQHPMHGDHPQHPMYGNHPQHPVHRNHPLLPPHVQQQHIHMVPPHLQYPRSPPTPPSPPAPPAPSTF